MTSVNTNAAATTALRTLQMTNKTLETTQSRVSTGLKIGEAKDNAAYWAISTTLKSDNKSLATVKDALGLGAATVDTAYQGLNKAKDVLDEIKSKLTAATQDGVDRAIIQSEIKELQNQLKSIASSSTFSGENWLSVDSSATGYNGTKELVSSFSRAANNSVAIGTISVDTSTIKLFDSSTTANGIIDKTVALTKADGTVLTVGGISTGTAPTAASLVGVTGGTAGTGLQAGTAATVEMAAFSLTNIRREDRITFSIAVDGGAAQQVQLETAGITTQANFLSSLNTALGSAVGAGVVTAAVNTAGNITLTSASTGTGSSLVVTGLAAADGNGTLSSVLGTTGSALVSYGTATAASATAGTAVAPAVTFDAGDGFTVNFTYDGAVFTTALVGTGFTAATTTADVATAIATAMNTATGGANITGSIAGGLYTFTTNATGAAKSISVLAATLVNTDATATESVLGLAASPATGMGSSAAATYAAGTLNTTGVDGGDTLRFDLNVSGVTTAMAISTEGFTGTTATDRPLFVSRIQAALNAAAIGATVAVDAGTNAITFTTTALGAAVYIGVDNVRTTDGDGQTTGTLGLSNEALTTGGAATAATASTAIGTTGFTGPLVLDADDSLTFTLTKDGGAATSVTINRALINSALSVSNGTITSTANLVTVTQAALTAAAITDVTVSDNGGGTNRLRFTANTAGAGSIVIGDVVGISGSNQMSVADMDIASTSFSALTSSQKKDVLSAYISVVNNAITSITSAASNLGSVSSRIDMQKSFVDTLIDTIEEGVGNLIDSDLTEESTRLQALQTKQSLGVQALSIANQSTQSILRLFQ